MFDDDEIIVTFGEYGAPEIAYLVGEETYLAQLDWPDARPREPDYS